jgi:hypothetical protein
MFSKALIENEKKVGLFYKDNENDQAQVGGAARGEGKEAVG